MSDKQPILDEIYANLTDDEPRLRYADLLTAENNPLGEFIRIQCKQEKLKPYEPGFWKLADRAAELSQLHGDNWLPQGLSWNVVSARGFPSHIGLTDPDIASVDVIDRFPTITGISLFTTPRSAMIPLLETRRQLASLRRLTPNRLTPDPFEKLEMSPATVNAITKKLNSLSHRLISVSVAVPDHFPELIDSILESDSWHGLSYLNCFGPNWSPACLLQLLKSPRFQSLNMLSLVEIPATAPFLNAIDSAAQSNLQHLTLSNPDYAVSESLFRNDRLSQLESLSISMGEPHRIVEIRSQANVPNLRRFDLLGGGQTIHDNPSETNLFFKWAVFPHLEQFRLMYVPISVDFFDQLGQHENTQLKWLAVNPTDSHADSLQQFLKSYQGGIQYMELSEVTPKLLTTLADSSIPTGMKFSLNAQAIDDAAIQRVLESDFSKHLAVLRLSNAQLSESALKNLVQSDSLTALESLKIISLKKAPSATIAVEFRQRFGLKSLPASRSLD